MPILSKPDFERAMTKFHEEAAGAFNIWTVPPERALELIVGALFGDQDYAVMATVISKAAKDIIQASRTRPALCLCCPRELRNVKGCTFAIMAAELRYDRGMICSAICYECSRKDGLDGRVMAAVTKVWPQARKIDVHDGFGTA